MTIKELKKMIKHLPDNAEVEINSVYDEIIGDLGPSDVSEAHFDKGKNKFFFTPFLVATKGYGGKDIESDDDIELDEDDIELDEF